VAVPHDQQHDQQSTGDLLQAAARSLRGGFMHALAEHDVTPAQSRALRVVLGSDEAPRLSDVAERLRVAPRTATEVVDALEKRGLVERVPDPDDRRATRLRTTPAGLALGEVMARTRAVEADRFLAVLSDDDRRELHRILSLLEES
jgi:DNA-binding MarR family transcriptional regulator